MKNRLFLALLIMVVTPFFLSKAQASDWRFPIHLNYVGGLSEVFDLYKNNMEHEGYDIVAEFVLPVGVSFNPYLQFDSGLRVGGGLGPAFVVLIEENGYFALPLNINAGYTLLPNGPFSPYIKGGISYHLAGGEYHESSKPGLFAAAGLVLMNDRRVNFGFEISTDLSKVEFENYDWEYYVSGRDQKFTTIQPAKLLISLFVQF